MNKIILAVLVIAVTVNVASSGTTSAATIYESATLGPTGQGGGVTFDETFTLGSRFSLTDPVQITAIGGHLDGAGFGAIVALPSSSAFPSFLPLGIESNALAGVAFSTLPVTTSDDVRIPLSLLLLPGDYALLFGGQGPFGSDPDTSGTMTQNNTTLPAASYFFGTADSNQWHEGGFVRARFVVEGVLAPPIPEPSTLVIFALGLAGMGFMRRRRTVI